MTEGREQSGPQGRYSSMYIFIVHYSPQERPGGCVLDGSFNHGRDEEREKERNNGDAKNSL